MKILNGSDLASYIKERQIRQVRALRQSDGVNLKLAIVITKDDPVINTYVRLKKEYGKDIGIEVEELRIDQSQVIDKLKELNNQEDIHGIIVQLPLEKPDQTDEILQVIDPKKDVDGLCQKSLFTPATPMAIDWLLAGYNEELKEKKIVIVGKGRLVGEPLYDMWVKAGHNVTVVGREDDLAQELRSADIIIAATGQPALIKSEIIPIDTVVVDAGVASEEGEILGDLDPVVYDRDDLTITPKIGGVGPLTVAALFDNLIRSVRL